MKFQAHHGFFRFDFLKKHFFFVLLRLVIFLSCMNKLVGFVQNVGVGISNHEQPTGKLRSLQTIVETCRQGFVLFCFSFPLTHDNKDPT